MGVDITENKKSGSVAKDNGFRYKIIFCTFVLEKHIRYHPHYCQFPDLKVGEILVDLLLLKQDSSWHDDLNPLCCIERRNARHATRYIEKHDNEVHQVRLHGEKEVCVKTQRAGHLYLTSMMIIIMQVISTTVHTVPALKI